MPGLGLQLSQVILSERRRHLLPVALAPLPSHPTRYHSLKVIARYPLIFIDEMEQKLPSGEAAAARSTGFSRGRRETG